MTPEEAQLALSQNCVANGVNPFSEKLTRLLVPPRRILVIQRNLVEGDRQINVWLVGQEPGGYYLIMKDGQPDFGLATKGFQTDQLPVLIGWYGNLQSAFEAM